MGKFKKSDLVEVLVHNSKPAEKCDVGWASCITSLAAPCRLPPATSLLLRQPESVLSSAVGNLLFWVMPSGYPSLMISSVMQRLMVPLSYLV
jgi:hypothetical protein